MPYIGRSPEYGGLERQLITANGSDATFALTYPVGSDSSILVSVAGVLQQPGTAYNISGGGTNIVFTAAPPTNSNVFVVFLGRAYDSQNIALKKKQTVSNEYFIANNINNLINKEIDYKIYIHKLKLTHHY